MIIMMGGQRSSNSERVSQNLIELRRQIQNQNLQLRKNSMKLYSSNQREAKMETPIKRSFQCHQEKTISKTTIRPIIIKQEKDSSDEKYEQEKCSMQQLCHIFLERVASQGPTRFDTKDLVDTAEIKQRRIYDLMNILEGCNYVRRISKGTYDWFGFTQAERFPIHSKKEPTSLHSLARKVKDLLISSKTQIDFKQICSMITQENSDKKINPESIKRRVYECCKVLKVIGLLQKNDHKFKWIPQSQRQNIICYRGQNVQQEHFSREQKEKRQKLLLKQNQKNILQEKQLIKELLKPISSETELQGLLIRIKYNFEQSVRKIQFK